MYAFRFEHKTKLAFGTARTKGLKTINSGPYSYPTSNLPEEIADNFKLMSRNHSKGKHPNIWDDLGMTDYSEINKHFCACPSLETLKKWFFRYNAFLLENNFVIVAYELSNLVEGKSKKQVFFKRENIISKTIIR